MFHNLLHFFTCAFSDKHVIKGSDVHIVLCTINILLAFFIKLKGDNRGIIPLVKLISEGK